MDAKKIIMDLNYRIESADENDPERENAIRLREAMMAARDLEDTVFPDLHIEQEFLKLAKEA